MGSIYTSQVLRNIDKIDHDPFATPSLFAVTTGQIGSSNTITPSVSIPLGNQVTRTVATGGITQVVGQYNGFGVNVAEGWTQTWTITPQTDANVLRILHAVYRYALGQRNELDGILPPSKPAPRGTGKPVPNPPPSSTANKPSMAIPGSRSLEQDTDDFRADCNSAHLPNGGCFQTMADAPCAQIGKSPVPGTADSLVCLGKYGESLLQRREMTVSENAYNSGVIYHLVLISLQAEADANPPKAK